MAGTGNTRDGQVPKYFYATGGWGRETVIYAYTEEEWGLGGHSARESGNTANSLIGQSVVAIIMTIPAIVAPLSMLVGIYATISSFPDLGEVGMGLIWFVGSIVCTLLFTGGWLVSVNAIRSELRARRIRKPKGLPTPLYAVTDDQARRWFEEHPGTLEISRENFPLSTRPFPDEPEYLPSQEKRA
ncbi:hypothetical protein [Pseudarthrobacter sp. LMD1-1-1.1]|uniref:hypothetical protein n=1 Tax=Pseudarthrobacter sp. LMD1-1-1.1 TaxID=3135242 RepID=UPI003438A8CD